VPLAVLRLAWSTLSVPQLSLVWLPWGVAVSVNEDALPSNVIA
jgi:hypothetical protein